MKKTTIKNISQNSLEELSSLIYEITNKLTEYSHVSQHLPKSLINEIGKFCETLKNEHNNRIN